jgi:hypothetical protein
MAHQARRLGEWIEALTGLLDLGRLHSTTPALRVIVRDEPLHPPYRKRATDREKQLGRRHQLVAINTEVGQIDWLVSRDSAVFTLA